MAGRLLLEKQYALDAAWRGLTSEVFERSNCSSTLRAGRALLLWLRHSGMAALREDFAVHGRGYWGLRGHRGSLDLQPFGQQLEDEDLAGLLGSALSCSLSDVYGRCPNTR